MQELRTMARNHAALALRAVRAKGGRFHRYSWGELKGRPIRPGTHENCGSLRTVGVAILAGKSIGYSFENGRLEWPSIVYHVTGTGWKKSLGNRESARRVAMASKSPCVLSIETWDGSRHRTTRRYENGRYEWL